MIDMGFGRLEEGLKGDNVEVVDPGGKESWLI